MRKINFVKEVEFGIVCPDCQSGFAYIIPYPLNYHEFDEELKVVLDAFEEVDYEKTEIRKECDKLISYLVNHIAHEETYRILEEFDGRINKLLSIQKKIEGGMNEE